MDIEERRFYPKLITMMKGYSSSQAIKDVVSGIIVAIIALPLSIALALCSGVGPQEGLYTAIIAGFIISFLGGCSVQIAGPTAAFATMVAGIYAQGGMDLLALSGILAGVFLIIFGLFKLGNYIKYMPYPITVGFTAGVAGTIFIGQLKDFFGIIYQNGERPIETVEKLTLFVEYFNTFNIYALIIGIISFLIIVFWSKLPKIGTKIPSSLIAIIVSVFMVKLLNWDVKTIGDLYTINSNLPNLRIPNFKDVNYLMVLKNGFSISVLAAIESLLSAVVADKMTGDKHYPNTELIAQGAGNIASALFGGIPATGAIARTAANIKNGGKTPIAGMVHAIVLLLILLFLVPYTAFIPMPCIAAILFSVAFNMFGFKNAKKIITDTYDSIFLKILNIAELIIVFVLTIFFDLIVAISIGVAGHIICNYLYRFISTKKQIR